MRPDYGKAGRDYYIMALGLRKVTIFGIHAYAAGIYLEESLLRSGLDQEHFLKNPCSYIIRIGNLHAMCLICAVATRDTSLSHIRGALSRNLEQSLKAMPVEEQSAAREQLAQFLGCFPNVKIKMGEAISLHRDEFDHVYIVRPECAPMMVKSPWIGKTLLSFYLDQQKTSIPKHYAMQETGLEYEVIAAYDNNQTANLVYKHNFGLTPTNRNIEHFEEFPSADCWLLSPPCQPYTAGGNMLDELDDRAHPLHHLINLLQRSSVPPRWVFLENVPNFEKSRSRERLVNVLSSRGYRWIESLITPMDHHVGIPNNRLRYYLAAERIQNDPLENDSSLVRDLSSLIGPAPGTEVSTLEGFLLSQETQTDSVRLNDDILEHNQHYRHDIVRSTSRRSATFTKGYGSRHIIGTGSILQTRRLDADQHSPDLETLKQMGLRYFAPDEIALLHGLPLRDHPKTDPNLKYKFSFPEKIITIQKYRLLGNSLNVRVVSILLKMLFLGRLSAKDTDGSTNMNK